MIAMQYSFVLPADYDMGIINTRVREKGHALDHHVPLVLKAYGVSRAGDVFGSRENQYAPFYLWKDAEAMRDFLCSPGFAGLVASFGWPEVRHWPLMMAERVEPQARNARVALRTVSQVAKFTDLARLRDDEARRAEQAVEAGAVVAVAAIDPASWSLLRYQAWARLPEGPMVEACGGQFYEVQHVSAPGLIADR